MSEACAGRKVLDAEPASARANVCCTKTTRVKPNEGELYSSVSKRRWREQSWYVVDRKPEMTLVIPGASLLCAS